MQKIVTFIFFSLLFLVDCKCKGSKEKSTNDLDKIEIELKTHTSEELKEMEAFSLQMLKVVNMIRTQPREFLKHLENVKNYFLGNSVNVNDYRVKYNGKNVIMKTHEGLVAIDEAISIVNKMITENVILPALTYNSILDKPALLHAKYMDRFDFFGHYNDKVANFESPGKRLSVYCKYSCCGENLWSGIFDDTDSLYARALDIVTDLFIDDGVADRGHRKLLLSTAVTDLGNSIYKTKGDRYLSVMNFGAGIVEKK